MRTGTIYCLQNVVTGRRYVGQTLNFNRRMGDYAKGRGHGIIGRSIAQHGWDNFAIKIVEEIPEETLDEAERFWIDFLECQSPHGYNITSGGDDNPMQNPEVRAKASATHKSKADRGNHHTQRPEFRAKVSATIKSLVDRGEHNMQNPEVRAKVSATHKAMAERGENPMQNPEVAAKVSAKHAAKGAQGKHHMQNPEVRAKASATHKAMVARGEHSSQQPEWKAKQSATHKAMAERGEHPMQDPEIAARAGKIRRRNDAARRLKVQLDAGQQFLCDMEKQK